MPAIVPRFALRRGPHPGRRLSRPPRRDPCRGGRGAGARRAVQPQHAGHRVRAVARPRDAARPDGSRAIETEIVVNAAGMWAPQVAAMVGAFVPSTPVDHQHVALKAVPGHELPRDMPCFRDPDNLVYGKSEHGGMVFGGYEAEPRARWLDGVPWEHAATSLPPDWERFAPLMDGAIRRFPFLADAEAIRLVCHPDAMTPDGNPLLGPMPGLRGFWMAAGLSLNGFGGGGGIGRAMAGWITAGDPGVDVAGYRAWRFARHLPRPGLGGRSRARDVRRLLPPAVPVRRRRGGPAAPTLGAPRSAPGDRRGIRHQGGLGASRPAPSGVGVASRRPPSSSRGLGAPGLVRAGRGGAAGRSRAGRDHRPLVVRQDRGRGPRCARRAPAGLRQ